MHYVIVGGGVAGTTAAEELRKLDPDSEITLVCDEQHPLYSRVLLGHYVQGKVSRERVFLKKESWYEENRIEWFRGVHVDLLDTQNKFVALSDGRELSYDKLLISSGKEVRTVEYDQRGVMYFRTIDDADHILQLLAEQGKDARGGIYGGGFIACEFLNIYETYKIPTLLAFRGRHFWNNNLLPEAGELLLNHFRSKGVEVIPNAEFVGLLGEKELRGFISEQGEHNCTLLGVGVGILSDFSWLENAGVEMGVGVLADKFLQTNVKDVYVAGDISEFDDVCTGRKMNVGTWLNAITQGRVVAKNMTGEPTVFELVSSYAMNVLGMDIIFVGDVAKSEADEVHLVGSVGSGGVTQVFERGGRVVGGVMINRNTDRKVITDAVKNKMSVSDVLEKINR
jgi:NAD(P)H-nitrite reductase large subunit